MPATTAKLDPDTLVPGWAAEDVARLDELADLGMDLARTLTKQVLAHDAACERGEAKPISAADAARIALDFSRIARAVRLTLTLKAHARDPNAAAAMPGSASTRASAPQADPVLRPLVVNLDHPFGPDDPEDFGDPVECAQYGAAVIRRSLDYALSDPLYEPAERERLYDVLERRLECETEAGNITVNAGSSGLIWQIAKDLGLDDRCTLLEDETGLHIAWIVPRLDEELQLVTVPAADARLTRFKQPWTKPPDP